MCDTIRGSEEKREERGENSINKVCVALLWGWREREERGDGMGRGAGEGEIGKKREGNMQGGGGGLGCEKYGNYDAQNKEEIIHPK